AFHTDRMLVRRVGVATTAGTRNETQRSLTNNPNGLARWSSGTPAYSYHYQRTGKARDLIAISYLVAISVAGKPTDVWAHLPIQFRVAVTSLDGVITKVVV